MCKCVVLVNRFQTCFSIGYKIKEICNKMCDYKTKYLQLFLSPQANIWSPKCFLFLMYKYICC